MTSKKEEKKFVRSETSGGMIVFQFLIEKNGEEYWSFPVDGISFSTRRGVIRWLRLLACKDWFKREHVIGVIDLADKIYEKKP